MYKESNISGKKYKDQDAYNEYFEEELKKAKAKCKHA